MTKVAEAVAAVEGGVNNRVLFDLGTKHAVMAIKADREACLNPSLDLFESAADQYDTTISHLRKALSTERNAETRAVVETKLAEYQARRNVMTNWIRDYRASRESSTLPPPSTGPGTPVGNSIRTTSSTTPQGRKHVSPAVNANLHANALPKSILGRTALDIAFGILLAAAMGVLFYALFQIFEPYLLPALMAAVVATALRPLSTRITLLIGGELPPMSKTERARFEASKAKTAGRSQRDLFLGWAATLVPMSIVFIMAAVRSTSATLIFLGLCVSVAAIAAVTLFVGRAAVASKSISAHGAAAGITVASVISFALLFGSLFAVGISKDIVQGLQDAAGFAHRLADETGGSNLIGEQIDVLQNNIAQGVAQNQAAVMEYTPTIHHWTGADMSEAVELIAGAASKRSGTNGLPVAELRSAVLKQLPSSVDELKGRGLVVVERVKELEIDMEPIKTALLQFAQTAAESLGDFAAKVGETFQRIGAVFAFVGLLPVFLGRKRSVISLFTDILPMPHKRHNDQLEIDLRTAIGALVHGIFQGFVIETAFVYLLFNAFQLNLEFLSSLLAGIGSTLPFLPPGWIFTLVLGVPQLVAGGRWIEMVAMLVLHLLLDTGIDGLLDSAQDGMKVGSGILNRQLFTLSIVLALPLFGRKAAVLGPLTVIMGMVVYETYKFINEEKQAVEDA